MSLQDKLNQLEPRERRLLGILAIVFGVFLVLALPLGISAYVGSKRDRVEGLRTAIAAIEDSRQLIAKRNAQQEGIRSRYARPAPPLASFLASQASKSGVEIPETQDQATVPHGKKYTERATRIRLRKVGLLALSTFMEHIAQSGYPVSISKLNIRKRGTEPDSYDVEMTVSAFDRKEPEKKAEDSDSEQDEG